MNHNHSTKDKVKEKSENLLKDFGKEDIKPSKPITSKQKRNTAIAFLCAIGIVLFSKLKVFFHFPLPMELEVVSTVLDLSFSILVLFILAVSIYSFLEGKKVKQEIPKSPDYLKGIDDIEAEEKEIPEDQRIEGGVVY